MDVGERFGPSSWVEIQQDRVNGFADATDDHQWIHVDPERAATGPFGTTIAHGYLTLSLIPAMTEECLPRDPNVKMGINYGLNRVRFPSPVPVGSRVRGSFEVVSVEEIPGGTQTTLASTIEREGGDKPVCVAEIVFRHYF